MAPTRDTGHDATASQSMLIWFSGGEYNTKRALQHSSNVGIPLHTSEFSPAASLSKVKSFVRNVSLVDSKNFFWSSYDNNFIDSLGREYKVCGVWGPAGPTYSSGSASNWTQVLVEGPLFWECLRASLFSLSQIKHLALIKITQQQKTLPIP